MLTYFLFLQLGTAYESGAFNSAPSPRLGERKLEALWDSRIRIREKHLGRMMDPKGNEKFAIFMFFFNLKCWYIYIYLYMFREDLYLFLFVHFLVGQNVGIPTNPNRCGDSASKRLG